MEALAIELKTIFKSHRILFAIIVSLVVFALLLMLAFNFHLHKLLSDHTISLEGLGGVEPARDTTLLQRQHSRLEIYISGGSRIFSGQEYKLKRDLLNSRVVIMETPFIQESLGHETIDLLGEYKKQWVHLQPKLDLLGEDIQNESLRKEILLQLDNMEGNLFNLSTGELDFWRNSHRSQQIAINRTYKLLSAIFTTIILLAIVGVFLLRRTFIARERDLIQINYLANFDALTGLPNRHFLIKDLQQSLLVAERYGFPVTFMFLDLDRFKYVNDTLGHDAGDKLLIEVTKRLRNCFRKSDIIARLGGDEFAVLMPHTKATQAYITAERIIKQIKEPVEIANSTVSIGISIGISEYPSMGKDVKSLMKQADIAMYKAKEQSEKSSYALFSERDSDELNERIQLEADMRKAISKGQFILYYQPRFHLATGCICCLEALIRWQHPKRGLVQPGVFIPIAEASAFIHSIGTWVIHSACAQIKQWQQQGIEVRVSANLSIQELQRGEVVEHVKDALFKYDIEPSYLELEVTEHVAMSNVTATVQTLKRLRDLGVKLSIDDFGSGHSSLNYLKHLPVDTLKIDKSFLNEVQEVDGVYNKDANIISSIISLAHSLSLSTVVEGVETQDQLSFLHKIKTEEVQGFLLGKPLPVEETTTLLLQNASEEFPLGRPQVEGF